jgi:hypothetical protein
MARKRPAPKYAGALAQPIYVDMDQIDPANPDSLKEMWPRAREKMRLLFEHSKIDPSDKQSWVELGLTLACEHVPGLQLVPRPKIGKRVDSRSLVERSSAGRDQ